MGKDWFETCLPKRFKKDVVNVYKHLMAGEVEVVEHYENLILKKDGGECIIAWHNTVLRDQNNNITGILTSGNDITDQKKSEEALKQAEEKLKKALEITELIIDNAPLGIMIVGKNKVVQQINKAALIMSGHDSKKDIVGHVCHKNICPTNIGQCPITDLNQVLDQSEKNIICKDGRQIPVYKTARGMEIDGQDVVLEAFMDIGPLKRVILQ